MQAIKDASQRPERAAWADWLVSIQSEISENLYRQYQADSFALAMRYISGQVQSTSQPQPQQSVQPQLSTLPQQQYITLSAIPPRGHQQQSQFATQIQVCFSMSFPTNCENPLKCPCEKLSDKTYTRRSGKLISLVLFFFI